MDVLLCAFRFQRQMKTAYILSIFIIHRYKCILNYRNFVLFSFLWFYEMGKPSCNNVALPYFYIRIFTGGGLQFRRISAVAQKYFDALPCFSHDNHAMLFINCKYISINPNVPCLNVILTNSMQNFTF